MDWGPEFYTRHSACFPNFGGPPLTANIGWLGLQHILTNGGSGYFPMRIVLPYVDAKQLHIVKKRPNSSCRPMWFIHWIAIASLRRCHRDHAQHRGVKGDAQEWRQTRLKRADAANR